MTAILEVLIHKFGVIPSNDKNSVCLPLCEKYPFPVLYFFLHRFTPFNPSSLWCPLKDNYTIPSFRGQFDYFNKNVTFSEKYNKYIKQRIKFVYCNWRTNKSEIYSWMQISPRMFYIFLQQQQKKNTSKRSKNRNQIASKDASRYYFNLTNKLEIKRTVKLFGQVNSEFDVTACL